MNILSLFDGISCGRIALERAGISIENYYASEIDKHSKKIALANFPNTIQLGDVRTITAEMIPDKIDVLVGGSPCTDLSVLNKNGKGLEGKKSGLFYEFVRLKEELKPKYFLLENVYSMKREFRDKITELLGVEPILLNSKLVSAQSRSRLYWTNIPGIVEPEDRGILLKDIIESGYTEKEKSSCLTASYNSSAVMNYFFRSERQKIFTCPITAVTHTASGFTINTYYTTTDKIEVIFNKKEKYVLQKARNLDSLEKLKQITRKLTVKECERLQTLPEKYCYHVSDNQQYKAIGNGFTVDMVAHIFSFIPLE